MQISEKKGHLDRLKDVIKYLRKTQSSLSKKDADFLIDYYRKLILERKKSEEELSKLSIAVEQNPATIVITDIEGKITYVNKKFSDLTGYSKNEALGKNPRILKSGETLKEEYNQLWDTITSGKEWKGEFHNKKKNGDLYWESAVISPIKNKEGKIINFIAIKEDITDRKNAEDKLKEQMDMLTRFKESTVDQLLEMKSIEEENLRLKKLIASQEKSK